VKNINGFLKTGALVLTKHSEFIVIFSQYAYTEKEHLSVWLGN